MNVAATVVVLAALAALCTAADTWETRATLPIAVSDHTAVVVSNYVVVVGGCSGGQTCGGAAFCGCTAVTNATQVHSVSGDSWTVAAAAPRARYRHVAVVSGRLVYVMGGRDLADNLLTAIDVLDTSGMPSQWTWTTLAAPMPNPRSDMCAFVVGSTAYVVGGYTANYDTLASVAAYSFPHGTWTGGADMAASRGDLGCAAQGGKGFVFGGFSAPDFCAALGTLEEYDPTSDSWTSKATLATGRGDKAFARVANRIFAVGGERKNATTNCSKYSYPITDVDVYTPASDSWESDTPIPDQRFRFAAVAIPAGILVTGGQGPLNTATDSYAALATTEVLRVSSSAATLAPPTAVSLLALAALLLLVVV